MTAKLLTRLMAIVLSSSRSEANTTSHSGPNAVRIKTVRTGHFSATQLERRQDDVRRNLYMTDAVAG